MNIAGIHTTKPRTQRYVDAFVRGTPGPYKIYDFKTLQTLPEEDLAMYGILAGSGEIYKRCAAACKDFYYMDHGLFLQTEFLYRMRRWLEDITRMTQV